MSEGNKPSHYHAFEITEKGMGLRQRAIAGDREGIKANVEFTRGAIGVGRPKQDEGIFYLDSLAGHVLDVPIKESYAQNTNHLMAIVIDNTKLQEDILMTEIGIFARLVDPVTGAELLPEILYGYTYTYKYDYIPAAADYFVYREICFNTVLSREGKFEVVFDKDKVYLTFKDFEGYIESLKSGNGAKNLGYGNEGSGLAATDAQGAIDELKGLHDGTMGNIEYEPIPDVIPGDGKDTFTGKGFLSRLWDRSAGVICGITGMDKWWKPPVMSISDISAQLGKAAQRDGKLQSNLYAAAANDMGNPDDGVTKENIFACPPLDKMATVSRHRFGYFGAEAISYKTPMPISTFDQLWEILTVKVVGGVRVVQYATQILADAYLDGMTFVRVRHVDNYDYTQWQAWKRLATAEPPEVYDLPLIGDLVPYQSGECSYAKNQFGEVTVRFNICTSGTTDTIAYGRSIATLPVGFRPRAAAYAPVCAQTSAAYSSPAAHVNASVLIKPSGLMQVIMYGNVTSAIVLGGLSFVAGN